MPAMLVSVVAGAAALSVFLSSSGGGLAARTDPEVGPSPPAAAVGSYAWPVHGPVLRRFEPPASPYGAGHRGIDIGTSEGTAVRAAQGGTVAFAGVVAGGIHVSIDHPDGIRTSYSFLSTAAVAQGDAVLRGTVIGTSGAGHAGRQPPHLHFGARYAGEYVDPMLLLERRSVAGLIRLAPLDGADRDAAPPPS